MRTWGGVPAVDPPTFELNQTLVDSITDFVCRWSVQGMDSPCTLGPSGDYQYLNSQFPDPGSGGVQQFCRTVESADTFPTGDTILSVRVRDVSGAVSAVKQIVVRVVL